MALFSVFLEILTTHFYIVCAFLVAIVAVLAIVIAIKKLFPWFASKVESIRRDHSDADDYFLERVQYSFGPEYIDTSNEDVTSELEEIDELEGWEFEYWCAELLRKCGYQNVSVTQASGDQGVDILAEKSGLKYAIQCKRFSKPLGNKPIQEVFTGLTYYRCDIPVVMTNNYFTDGAIQLARSTEVLLWDRSIIIEMLNTVKGTATASKPIIEVYPFGDSTHPQKPENNRNDDFARIKSIIAIVLVALLIIAFLVGAGSFINYLAKKQQAFSITHSNKTKTEEVNATAEPSPSVSPFSVEVDWKEVYAYYGANVIDVYVDVFAEYGSYYSGTYANTVVTIETITGNAIYAKANAKPSSDEYDFEFIFDDSDEITGLVVGDVVEIIGTIEGGEPIVVNQCHIVSFGEDAVKKNDELFHSKEDQIYYAEQYINWITANQ